MNLLDQSTREALVARINNLSPDAKGKWGRMSINGMVCHCADQLRVSLGDKGAPSKEAGFLARTARKFMVLYVIPIPKNVPTSPKVDQEQEGTKPTDFESDRKTLLEYIDRFTNAPEDTAWTPHFKFGPMNKKEWGILAAKHLDHHLKQFGA